MNAFVDEKTLAAKMSTAALQQAVDRVRLNQDAQKKPEAKTELFTGARMVLEMAGIDPNKDLSPWMIEQLNQAAAKQSTRLEQIPRGAGGGMVRRHDILLEMLDGIKDGYGNSISNAEQQELNALRWESVEKAKERAKAEAEEVQVNIGLLAKAEAVFAQGVRWIGRKAKAFYEEYVPAAVKEFIADAGEWVGEKYDTCKKLAVEYLPEPVVSVGRFVRDKVKGGVNFIAEKLGFGDDEEKEQSTPNARQLAETQQPQRGEMTERVKEQALRIGQELTQSFGAPLGEAAGIGPALVRGGKAGGREL